MCINSKMFFMKINIIFLLLAFLFPLQVNAQTEVSYTYDSNNRLTKVIYDNGTTITYNYDALGNRISKKVTGSPTEIMGDVDGDGHVTMADVYAIVDFIMGKNPSPFNENMANVNGDDEVNVADVTEAVKIINKNTTRKGNDGDVHNDVEPDSPIVGDPIDI